MIFYTPPKSAERIALIDFADAYAPERARREAVAWEIHKACRDIGFFYIVNHGMDQTLIDGQFDWMRRFFALPLADKMALHMSHSPSTFGYEELAGQVLDPDTPPDLKEGFQCGDDLPDDHPYVRRGLPRYGHNLWPEQLPGFRAHSLRYWHAVNDLSKKLLSILALSLDIEEHFFDAALETPIATLRMLRYPPHPAQAAPNQLGAGAHTDWGLVTLLAQDANGGLEVLNRAGDWIRGEPIPGSFVVNIGDMFKQWTNDAYQSNMHRVLNVSGRERFSIPFFQDGDYDTRIACLPSCTGPGRPERYAPCSAGDYLAHKIRETYGAAA